MSKDDDTDREVRELFERIHSERTLDDIKVLDALLPDNATVLRGLGGRCLQESRKAMRAGLHTEARRLDIIARQLQQRADRAKSS